MNDNCFTQSIRMRLCTNLRHRRDGRTGELPAVALRLLLAMGKIRGTPCMRSHILVHRATTKISANSFAFRSKIEKEGLPRGSTSALGAGDPAKTICPTASALPGSVTAGN